jgi:hypothetical protein
MRNGRNDQMVKRLGTFITLIGLAGAIGGFVSCRHFDDGDESENVSRVKAEYTSFYVMTLGSVAFAVGLYIRDKFTKPN